MSERRQTRAQARGEAVQLVNLWRNFHELPLTFFIQPPLPRRRRNHKNEGAKTPEVRLLNFFFALLDSSQNAQEERPKDDFATSAGDENQSEVRLSAFVLL